MEERRLLLAVALSLLVLTAYRLLVAPPVAPEASPSPRPTPAAAAASAAPAAPEAAPPRAAPAVPAVSDERERRVEVDGEDVTVAFSNRGARLVSWRLRRFKDASGRDEEMVQAVPGGPRPLDIESGDAALDARLREALFKPSSEVLRLAGRAPVTLRFEYAEGDVVAEKSLAFEPGGYLVHVAATLRQGGRPLPAKLVWGPGLGNPSAAEMEVQGYEPPHAVYLSGGIVERIPAEKVGGSRAVADVLWVGIDSRYFAALLVPPGASGKGEIRAMAIPAGEDGRPRLGPAAAVETTPDSPVLLYVGPKDYASLARLGHEFARIVPVGEWIGPIVVGLMKLLRLVQARVGSYGWSIVALTVLINLAMSPLRHYSIANGVKMAKLAPEMKVIQERYRGIPALDKRREQMQKEMAALYARHGMSMGSQMMVGCLPLLLTMPFLIAFYRVLQVSIELRGASFLWLPDLSQKDPLYVTPVLMGASMFLMQKMTPTAMDPAQQRMMMIMPLVLMVMFFAAPAGLNLYWLSSNVCSILQQAVTLRIVRTGETGKGERRKR